MPQLLGFIKLTVLGDGKDKLNFPNVTAAYFAGFSYSATISPQP